MAHPTDNSAADASLKHQITEMNLCKERHEGVAPVQDGIHERENLK